jgi:hypothetical protein
VAFFGRCGQNTSKIEEIVEYAVNDLRIVFAFGFMSGSLPECGVNGSNMRLKFIDGTVTFDTEMVFGEPDAA